MTSKTIIANRALTKIGDKRITSLDEDSKAASTLNAMWDSVLDAELTAHTWNFTKARAVMPKLTDAPLFGFSNQYQLPADCLRLLQVGEFLVYPKADARGLFSIEEGHRLLTDLNAPLALRYVKRITDPNAYSALFAEAFACKLAVEACEAITQSNTKKQTAAADYDRTILLAIRSNAIERPSQPIGDDTWLESRNSNLLNGQDTPVIRS